MSSSRSVLVLRKGTHGMPVDAYAQAIESRLSGGGRDSDSDTGSDPEYTVDIARTPTEERTLIRDARYVTGMTLTDDVIESAEALEVFACAYAGTGHLPQQALAERGVTVTNASGVHGPNIAEHVIGAILSFTRRFHVGARRQRQNEWRHYTAYELQGSTVTVVGLGGIGQAIIPRLGPFGVETIGVRYSTEKGGPTDEVIGFEPEPFEDALARTDYLVLACPLTDDTRGLLDTAAFDTLPSKAVVINVARGPVIDTDALLSALQRGAIRGASLDVTDPEPLPPQHPLWSMGNVQLTPHNAGHTPKYYDRLADIVAENACRFFETGSTEGLENQVSLTKSA